MRHKSNISTRAIIQQPNISTRSTPPVSYDEKTNSVEAVATTEAPTMVWDWDRFDIVSEVLRMDGVELPGNGQVPLLDSHNRSSVKNVLGSASDFKTEDVKGVSELLCKVLYSETEDGKDAMQKTREGHLTDFSVGYAILEKFWVSKGQSQIIGDREYKGPVSVVTKWKLKELSITPIGADEQAKVRNEVNAHNSTRSFHMDKKLKALLIKRGLAEDASDAEAWNFFAGIDVIEQRKLWGGPEIEPPAQRSETPLDQPKSIDVEAVRAQSIKDERTRIATINGNCRMTGLDETFAEGLVERGLTAEEAGQEIFRELAKTKTPVGRQAVETGTDEADKFRAAASDALQLRSGIRIEKPAPGFESFRGLSLLEIGRECLERNSVSTRGMGKKQLATQILSGRASATSTSDFPYLMAAVVNKRLQRAYTEAPSTWRPWTNVVGADDFKSMYGLKLSESPDLELITENGEYKEGQFSENQESYFVATYGKITWLTRKMIINDDLRGFTRIPQLFGAAARRKESDIVYTLLTSNPTMNDGSALFASGHNNLASGGDLGVVSTSTLKASRTAMRLQKGLKGKTLDVMPAFVLVPTAQEIDTEIILRSAALPDSEKSSGVYNPWNGKLTPIAESRLDANSATAWYLIADPAQVDTIEVAYLEGEEQPYIDEEPTFERDGLGIKVRHDFGAGIMDHVGFYKNPGA